MQLDQCFGTTREKNEKRPRVVTGASGIRNFKFAYFVQKVARPWQVTMPPSGLHLYCLLTTL